MTTDFDTTPTTVSTPETGGKLLLAASTGGHLAQLVRLAPGLGATDDSLWVTFRTPQSESLLKGRNVLYVPYIRPRDAANVVRAYQSIRAAIKNTHFDGAVSTGSALALAALPAAKLGGLPTLYIESVSRVDGPSLSGRILDKFRLAELRTQHPHWSSGRWGVHPSVLSTFHNVQKPKPADGRLKLFVTLGTIEGYGFDSLVDRIVDLGIAGDDTTWQLGYTEAKRELPGTAHAQVSAEDFERYAREADVVITHAGVGTVLGLLEMGISPIAVVRRKDRGEHVDNHQEQIARLMSELGIGTSTEVEDLTSDMIHAAAMTGIRGDLAAA
ncbi:MAG: glycosyltransferase [Leifsonia flava]